MDDSEPGSLFVVVFYDEDPSFSILQLDTLANLGPEQTKNTNVDDLKEPVVCFDVAEQIKDTNEDDLKEHVVSFDVAEQIKNTNVDDLKEPVGSFDVAKARWSVTPPISSSLDLYLLPDWCTADKPLHGYKFNSKTGSFQNICLPPSMIKEGETVSAVNLGGRIYRMERYYRRWPFYCLVYSLFNCYDPVKKSWKPLKPFPPSLDEFRVKATAVWDDTILFNVDIFGLWAYDVHGNEWYAVNCNNSRCLDIGGEAVVLDSTIYALTDPRSDVFLALSIEKERSGGDLVFYCSVLSEIEIPDLISMCPQDKNGRLPPPHQVPWVRSTHLVHLGKADFCVVRSCDPLNFKDPKPIHVTYMRLTGETKMTVLSNHWFKTRHEKLSEVVLCFSLPKCKTTALEEGKRFVFELDPFTPEAKCSISVRDLLPNVTATQVEKGLMKFGPMKRGGIQVKKNKNGKYFSFFEFEGLISKPLAIKASTLTLGGCPAKISEEI